MSAKSATVIVKRLQSPHQSEPFTQYLPLSKEMKEEAFTAVAEILDAAGGKALLKSSGDVYIKPNAIDSKPYSHTRVEVVEAVIKYWKENGARNIYLFENCTQSNFTRMVFALTGYSDVCKKYGVREIYLDEEKNEVVKFKNDKMKNEAENDYTETVFRIPKFVASNLIDRASENLYINLPKLKTHSMAGVTLGIKNQWAFPQPADRRADHNYNLASKLADVLGHIRPDFTLIEGVEGTIHGHYPVTAFADKCVLPFKTLIGSTNVLAADLMGLKLFGLTPDEDARHIKIALDRGYGNGVESVEDIEIIGADDFVPPNQPLPWDLYPQFPPDVTIIKGTERTCREGCQNNPLTLLQILAYDYGGKGGFTIVMGKGHSDETIDAIQGRVLVVGKCAIKEAGESLVSRLGKKNVYFSGHCNDLCATTNALCHLMKVNPLVMAPMPFLKSIKLLLQAKINGTQARIPFFFAHMLKVV
ncbi:MAG: DUF362 domain-containing protein [Defluviitaleaceae bacterium]|nr:DUF362 domain-containing protein [Defluviitaleaceae bacterium]